MERDGFEEVEHEVGEVAFGWVGLADRAVVAADEETSVREKQELPRPHTRRLEKAMQAH